MSGPPAWSRTRQGVRNLDSLPGRRLKPPRKETVKVMAHDCAFYALTSTCEVCCGFDEGRCYCAAHCTFCGRRLA